MNDQLLRTGRLPGWRRNLQASWRDSLLLLREFAGPLFIFALVIIGGGLLFYRLSETAGQPLDSPSEGVYTVLALTFLQPLGEFPDVWYLQAFYFLMPLIGIGILATGLADFGRMFFNRRARSKEWEMAVASTFKEHVVLIGLGHLGFRVTKELREMHLDVVVIELNPQAELIDQAHKLNVPVIHDNGKRVEILRAAGTEKARAIAICTQDDNLNLQIALKARKMNPAIRVVIRIFDDEFADTLEEQFGFRALSATRTAAPKFAATTVGVDVTRPIAVEGQALSLCRLDVNSGSALTGLAVGEIEQRYDLSVVLLRRNGESDFHPAADRAVAQGDVLALLASPDRLSQLLPDIPR
ncbi:MAG: NAD-binding protein [Chloroflexota bacterium]|jgi:Trk K+ transport system NAD-binding subunit